MRFLFKKNTKMVLPDDHQTIDWAIFACVIFFLAFQNMKKITFVVASFFTSHIHCRAIQWINRCWLLIRTYIYYTIHYDTLIEINHCINLKVNMIVMHHQIWWEFNKVNHQNHFTILKKFNPMDRNESGFFSIHHRCVRSKLVCLSQSTQGQLKKFHFHTHIVIPPKEFIKSEKTSQLTLYSQHSTRTATCRLWNVEIKALNVCDEVQICIQTKLCTSAASKRIHSL